MVSVTEQYDAFPYPERDPSDEARRLISGSPSDPLEIDHFLFGGCRDWSRPLRALIAGGGTGDGLVQLAQQLASVGRPYEIEYIDLSARARAVAEARAKARGLAGIRFHTGSLLDAPDLGQFDYVDCCGVLHHLPDPAAGFAALRAALAPGGGMGFMVYAPHGRAGVYPLQAAFGALLGNMDPAARLAAARDIFARIPEGHPFRRNPNLGDHLHSDAGFYDLLLHGQDRAFSVPELAEVLAETGWRLQSFTMPGLYDLSAYAPVPSGLDPVEAMGIAEALAGTIKTHVAYAVPTEDGQGVARGADTRLIPHVRGGSAARLAQAVASGKPVNAVFGGRKVRLDLPRGAAPLIAGADGHASLADLAAKAGLAPARAATVWAEVERQLTPWGMLHYSALLV